MKPRALDKVVAPVSNLPYRSASSLQTPRYTARNGAGNALPIGNRRYSRLETCATQNWPDSVRGPAVQPSNYLYFFGLLCAAGLLLTSAEHTSELQSLTNLVCR